MPLMSTCVARLGSRFSMILDPIRNRVHYGGLGLFRQAVSEMIVGIDDGKGTFLTLPLTDQGKRFFIVDQHITMTSVRYEAFDVEIGAHLEMEIVAPFWPQDEKTSVVPAYILNFRVTRQEDIRWKGGLMKKAGRRATLRFGLKVPGAKVAVENGRLAMTYGVDTREEVIGAGGGGLHVSDRHLPTTGASHDLVFPIAGDWAIRDGCFELPVDVTREGTVIEGSLGLACHIGEALLESPAGAMGFKYTQYWSSVDEVAGFVIGNHKQLMKKSRQFDAVFSDSSLPSAAANLTAQSFQTYLMNTVWCRSALKEWFSVWEGTCVFHSTVDVTYQEAMFYFACWPQLLEMILEEWSHFARTPEEVRQRGRRLNAELLAAGEADFDGRILDHDMGTLYTAAGQKYDHSMPVEENADFLLMLYAHGKWWNRPELFTKYGELIADLVKYLLWADSTGNGFPDRGTANTIDDATPAVQYGRDNVYLGVKRLSALHAGSRMLAAAGQAGLASRCRREVRKAVKTFNAGWLGDHWGVCLDKSAKGMVDAWSRKPLPYKTLPGWDAYSLYTSNGLLYLMMVNDVPAGLRVDRLLTDLDNACRESMTIYGCGHSSTDRTMVWISMNIWRDCVAAYLGRDMLCNSERYWAQQVFNNTLGSDKPNCFGETSLRNDLTTYPRGAASFGLLLSAAGLTIDRPGDHLEVEPVTVGRWPLLPLAEWKKGKLPPTLVVEGAGKNLRTRFE